jgi:hypothetical protein
MSGQARSPTFDLANVQGGLPEWERQLKELHDECKQYGGGATLQDFAAARQRGQEIAELEAKINQRNQDVAKYFRRTKAQRAARKRALRLAQPILDKREVTEPKHFALELWQIFLAEFPGRGMKKAANEFIAKFVSDVTGEVVNPGNVKQIIQRMGTKRRQPVPPLELK